MSTAANRSTAASDPLPAPTGPFAVGRRPYDWTDHDRAEIYASDPAARRELVVWIWHPAEARPGADRAAYLPEPWKPTAEFLGLQTDGVRSHALEDAHVPSGTDRYPIVVLSPSGFPPLLLAALAEELASHGYVVVGVNHTYETAVTVFQDGRVIPVNPAAIAGALGPQSGAHEDVFRARGKVCERKAVDLAFVAGQVGRLDGDPASPFAGRLDLERFGSIGHSFGGVAALEWCRADPGCRAAVNLDGALWSEVGSTGLERPVLQVLADHPEFALPPDTAVASGIAPSAAWYEAERAVASGGWRTVHERGRPAYTVRVAGATHLSFLDVPFLSQEGGPAAAMLAATTIDARRMWRVTSDAVLAFYARHLLGTDGELLDGPDASYPELSFGPD